MIDVTVRFKDGEELTYQADREARDLTGGDTDGDLLLLVVDEILESDRFIGPQVDEFVGAWGNWDDPINVVAAFYDAARRVKAQVVYWEMGDDDDAYAAERALAQIGDDE